MSKLKTQQKLDSGRVKASNNNAAGNGVEFASAQAKQDAVGDALWKQELTVQ